MLIINGIDKEVNVAVYILDTKKTILDRIASSIGTLPKFLGKIDLPFITDMINTDVKIKLKTVIHIKEKNKENPQKFMEECCEILGDFCDDDGKNELISFWKLDNVIPIADDDLLLSIGESIQPLSLIHI